MINFVALLVIALACLAYAVGLVVQRRTNKKGTS
ncbi:immunity 49 family protein [Streptomyces sp. AC627_RSS907]|nr:immunity 49 family protein [Streptomyces sp. AC627_RSS907]